MAVKTVCAYTICAIGKKMVYVRGRMHMIITSNKHESIIISKFTHKIVSTLLQCTQYICNPNTCIIKLHCFKN